MTRLWARGLANSALWYRQRLRRLTAAPLKVGFGFLRHAFQDCFRCVFLMAFWAFKTYVLVVLGPSKGALGGLFGTLVAPGATPGLWERTLGHFWLSFVTFWGALLASLGTLVADIGCLWASFGPSLADFGELRGPCWTLCGGILEICGHFLFTSAEPRQTKEFLGNP